MNSILSLRNVTVEIQGEPIVENISLDINRSDTMVLFGPNGSGKSTLIKAIMGFESYIVSKGEIIFSGQKINGLSTHERAALGIGVLFQNPPKIRGVKLGQIADILSAEKETKEELARSLNMNELIDRDLNVNFSGGEMKRSELFQVLVQRPKLLLLDEPESGVDIENVALMSKVLDSHIKKYNIASLIITHTGYILDYIHTKNACVMLDKSICCFDDARTVFKDIRKSGYEKCRSCKCNIHEHHEPR